MDESPGMVVLGGGGGKKSLMAGKKARGTLGEGYIGRCVEE